MKATASTANPSEIAPRRHFSFSFFLFSLTLSFLVPIGMTPFFPLLIATGLFLIQKFKGLGVMIAIAAHTLLFLFSILEMKESFMWQFGLLCSFDLCYVLFFLTEERILLSKTVQEKPPETNHLTPDERLKLEEEIEKWKEEARQLKIEKSTPSLPHDNLREQFDEKSKVLTEVRKELFSAQENISAMEKMRENERLESTAEYLKVQHEMNRLLAENERLAKEIIHLEELISHIQNL